MKNNNYKYLISFDILIYNLHKCSTILTELQRVQINKE